MAVFRWRRGWLEERGGQLADQLEVLEAGAGDHAPSVVPHFLPQHHLARRVDPDPFFRVARMARLNGKPNHPAARDGIAALPSDTIIPEQEIEVWGGWVRCDRPPPAPVGRAE